MLITLFTSIPASRTEPDLGLFGYRGDDVSYRKDTNPTYCYRYFRILNHRRREPSGRSAGDVDIRYFPIRSRGSENKMVEKLQVLPGRTLFLVGPGTPYSPHML